MLEALLLILEGIKMDLESSLVTYSLFESLTYESDGTPSSLQDG